MILPSEREREDDVARRVDQAPIPLLGLAQRGVDLLASPMGHLERQEALDDEPARRAQGARASSRVRTRTSDFSRARCWIAAMSWAPTRPRAPCGPCRRLPGAPPPRGPRRTPEARARTAWRDLGAPGSRRPEIPDDEHERVVGPGAQASQDAVGERLRLLVRQGASRKSLRTPSVARIRVSPRRERNDRDTSGGRCAPTTPPARGATRSAAPWTRAPAAGDLRRCRRRATSWSRRAMLNFAALITAPRVPIRRCVTMPKERGDRPFGAALERPHRHLRGAGRLGPVPEPIHDARRARRPMVELAPGAGRRTRVWPSAGPARRPAHSSAGWTPAFHRFDRAVVP